MLLSINNFKSFINNSIFYIFDIDKNNSAKSTQQYTMARQDGTRQILDETKMERDLGVMVSDNLKVKNYENFSILLSQNFIKKLKTKYNRMIFLVRNYVTNFGIF